MSRVRLTAALVVLSTCACQRPKGPAAEVAPEPIVVNATSADAGEPTNAAAPPVGPAASGGASQEERRKVLAALLSGNHDVRMLPESSTDPGQSFDRGLRKRLTTIEVAARPRPDVQIGGSAATVPITNADRVVAGLRARFRYCFQRGSVDAPSMEGKLVLLTNVGKDGAVRNVTLATNAGLTPMVTDCVIAAMRRAEFDAPGSPSVLQTPLTFVQVKD